ncbi:hypothetical protein [Micrococcus terreus]|uniref:hypothetical protein n=1 Tax=Micrococcus terreus TaxID=574650 RepID=UPI003D708172
MEPNQALVTSIGESILAYLGKDSFQKLAVVYSLATDEVSVVMTPRDRSLDNQLRILGKMQEVEQLFIDEVPMSVRFESDESSVFASASSNKRQLAFTA